MKTLVQIENVSMRFETRKGSFDALRDINLQIYEGEVVSLIGHSGCGKSTLLNLIAGLTLPTDGGLICNGREIAGPGPDRAVVFQNHSLLPWLSCFENVYLGVERVFGGKENKTRLRERTQAALEMVHMAHAAAKLPGEVSGGMKQRIGIARAFAMEPKILLMDEPFGALDAMTRELMNIELLRIWSQSRKTVLFITHSIAEAIFLSDRVIAMTPRPGSIADIITIDLPRPRDLSIINTDRFGHYVAYLRPLLDARGGIF